MLFLSAIVDIHNSVGDHMRNRILMVAVSVLFSANAMLTQYSSYGQRHKKKKATIGNVKCTAAGSILAKYNASIGR